MSKRLALGLALLASASPAFAQIDLTTRASKDQMVQLESATGTKVDITPTEIKKTKEITIPFNVKRTGFFDLPATIPQADPTKVNFGSRNPEKGWGLRLARLSPKEGKVEVTMKMGVMSMTTTKESQPYAEDIKLPEVLKGGDGAFVLTLPKPLSPGVYAIVGFNGASGPGGLFSTKDGIAWVFEVPSPKPADAVREDPAQPTTPVPTTAASPSPVSSPGNQ